MIEFNFFIIITSLLRQHKDDTINNILNFCKEDFSKTNPALHSALGGSGTYKSCFSEDHALACIKMEGSAQETEPSLSLRKIRKESEPDEKLLGSIIEMIQHYNLKDKKGCITFLIHWGGDTPENTTKYSQIIWNVIIIKLKIGNLKQHGILQKRNQNILITFEKCRILKCL